MPRNSIGILFARARIPKTSNSVRIAEQCYLWMGAILRGHLAMREDGIAGVSSARERNVRPSSNWVFYTTTYIKDGQIFGLRAQAIAWSWRKTLRYSKIKKQIGVEVNSEELLHFVEQSMKLNPVEFMGLLKIMCVDGWVRGCPRVGGSLLGNQENKVPSSSPLEPATQAQEAEEIGFTSELQVREPMNLQNGEISIEENDATRALKVDSVSKTSNCESNLDCAGSIKMEHEAKPKSKSHRTARPLEEMLSEVIDTYLTLGRKQRQEIAVLLYQITEEKEKETQK